MRRQAVKLALASVLTVCLSILSAVAQSVDINKVTQPRVPMGPGLEFDLRQFDRNIMIPEQFPNLRAIAPTDSTLRPIVPPILVEFQNLLLKPSSIAILNTVFPDIEAVYFEPDSGEWKPFAMATGKPVIIECSKCISSVKVSYHDGVEQITVDVAFNAKLNLTYNEAFRWVLMPLESPVLRVGN